MNLKVQPILIDVCYCHIIVIYMTSSSQQSNLDRLIAVRMSPD